MNKVVDARGLSCPLPVLRTKAALEEGYDEVDVLVDHEAGRENVARFAAGSGFQVEIEDAGRGEWRLLLRKG
jgi:tRNA 2-thiouridine synthesizing protein A